VVGDNRYIVTELGNKVKTLRMSKEIKIRDLGEMCQTDYANLPRFENGQVNIRIMTLKIMAEKLRVDLAYFL
jgi:transcriptional regulator with XRE-family HTH domain